MFGKLRTNSDVLQLIKSFGERGDFIYKEGLTKWLASELNETEIAKVNDILKRNNITYQF